MKTLQPVRVPRYPDIVTWKRARYLTQRKLLHLSLNLASYGLMIAQLSVLAAPSWMLLLESGLALGILTEESKFFAQSRHTKRLHWATSILIALFTTLLLAWAAAIGTIGQAQTFCLLLGLCLAVGLGLVISAAVHSLNALVSLASHRWASPRRCSIAPLDQMLAIVWAILWDTLRGNCLAIARQ